MTTMTETLMDYILGELKRRGMTPSQNPLAFRNARKYGKKLEVCPCEFHARLLEEKTGVYIDGDFKNGGDYGNEPTN